MADFKLEAVKCKSCGSGLTVEINDYVTYCISCGNGFEIINGDLVPIEINFTAPVIPGEGDVVYKPFWYLKTTVEILERTSNKSSMKNLFGGSNSSTGDITFYIPCFNCSLDSLKHLATDFTTKNPVASPQKFSAKITGFAYGKKDAMKLAEFMLVSFEAEKSDMMKTFKYNINFNSCQILGVPFYKLKDGRLKDAVLGIEVR